MVRDQSSHLDQLFDESIANVLLLGDPSVGKTSLIYSLTNEDLVDDDQQSETDSIYIPARTSYGVSVKIIDYSHWEFIKDNLTVAIREAAVICIVYEAGSHDSLDQVAKYWIPTIRSVRHNHGEHIPIILVANKIDLRDNTNLLDKLNHIKKEFLDVENFIEVSALNNTNMVELITSAQEAIAYPLAPLFDPRTRSLTPKCQAALTEIFKLNDRDEDGLMNDREMLLFQEGCFHAPLKQDTLEDLKNIIRQSTFNGISNDSITLDGFHFLHALSIDNNRRDFTWQVLRKYHYDNQLNLKLESSTSTSDQSITSNAAISDTSSISSLVEDTKMYLKIDPRSTIRGRELISQLDIAPWLRENPRMVKTGLSITVTTFISFMAFKFLMYGISRGP